MDGEILFRAKRIDTGEWVEGLPSYDASGDITEIETVDCGFITVDPATICQYIGLTDRNDQKIFVGNVVLREVRGGTHKKGQVVRNATGTCGFWLKCADGEYGIFDTGEGKSIIDEVIGNIFDNPELLEMDVED